MEISNSGFEAGIFDFWLENVSYLLSVLSDRKTFSNPEREREREFGLNEYLVLYREIITSQIIKNTRLNSFRFKS